MAEVITSKNNDTVKFLASLSEKGTREHTGSFVMEGKRSVYEAVEAKVATQIVVSQAYTRTKDYSAVSKWHLPVTVLSDAMFQRVSETKTPQGILAVCKIRKYDLQAVLKEEDSILLLEDVRDPGNMGTVIRTAEVMVKYEGYIKREMAEVQRQEKLEEKKLPADICYKDIVGLRLEAAEKLDKIRPASLGQASRISGVNPADVSVLLIYLSQGKNK